MAKLSDKMLAAKTGLRTASPYQLAIFRHAIDQIDAYVAQQDTPPSQRTPLASAIVEAVAGSGKTTTIVGVANLIPADLGLDVVFLSFTKDVATELDRRLPRHVDGKTINSVGWRICYDFARSIAQADGYDLQIGQFIENSKGNKVWKVIRDRSVVSKKDAWDHGKDVAWLVGQFMAYGIVPAQLEGNGYDSINGLRDEIDTWNQIVNHFGKRDITDLPKALDIARVVIEKMFSITDAVSFDEQKYWPVVRKDAQGNPLYARKYDIVIVDEAQDLSPIDLAMLKLILKPGGLVMGVGDTFQSIYGFRGADIESMKKFKETFGCEELPLSICYRCGTDIVEHAQEIVPHIEAAPNAHKGAVEWLGEFTADQFNPARGDMIECRNNAPLVSFAYKLISARIPVFVKGRDIGKNIIDLIDKLKANDVVDLSLKLNLWQGQQIEIIKQDNPDDEDAVQKVCDKADTLRVFIAENGDNRIDSVKADIESLFDTKAYDNAAKDAAKMKGKVVLSTIHKAKGLEAHTVFHLDSSLLYKYTPEGTWLYQQEKNLDYVARTRAIERLVYINSKDFLTKDGKPATDHGLGAGDIPEDEVDFYEGTA